MFSLVDSSEEQVLDFLNEISQMKLLAAHPNIVSLVGCSTLCKHKFLVLEYVPYGDLLEWLRKKRKSVRKMIKLLCIKIQIQLFKLDFSVATVFHY